MQVTYADFSQFMQRLHLEVLKIEFYQYAVDLETESISMRDFGASLVSSEPPDAFRDRLAELDRRLAGRIDAGERVSFQQFYEFNQGNALLGL